MNKKANERAARLKNLMREKKISNVDLAEATGVSPQAVWQWVHGKAFPKPDIQKVVASFLNVSVRFLLYGETLDNPLLKNLPVKGTAKLGTTENFFVDLEYPVGFGDGYIPFPTKDQDAYVLRCEGESMMPRIKHGEYVVIEPNRQANPGDEVLVIDKSGRVMVKIWMYTRDGMAYFSSVNETVSQVNIPIQEIEKIQFVAAIVKSALREIS